MTPDGAMALPCPFCGKSPKILRNRSICAYECNPCGVTVCKSIESEAEALRLWNRRTPDPATQRVIAAAVAWNPTVRGASRDHLIPEARELSDAVEALAAMEKP